LTKSKSESSQYKFREISVDPTLVNNFAVEDRLHYNPMKQSDELLDLLQELSDRVRNIIETRLTTRQREVVEKIYFEQLTQTEAALELNICQPSVHKSIHGNIDYKHKKKRYGGALKKIRKICDGDEEIANIFKRIAQLKLELTDF
jgi:DNA-directed RNA polymerase specialized sigma subunit